MGEHPQTAIGEYSIRPLDPGDPVDISAWVDLRLRLWPEETREYLERQGRGALAADPPWIVFVAAMKGELAGFLDMNLRTYAEGCEGTPVPYVEGWFVRPEARGKGVGAALMRAAEAWVRENGFKEMGSDALAGNLASLKAHQALGFAVVETLVVFRKPL